jgi:hypothetical protein
MDSFRDHPSDFDVPAAESQPDREVALASGGDERRMHVRAYNYWVSLLEGRDFPSIEDLEPEDLSDFSANSVLLDFTCGVDTPATPYIGGAIREECGLTDEIRDISQVPSRSLLSRLTDHYMQIIANRAPVGFEAEFDNQRGEPICYRGILMPFSSDGDTIDFIYGVINWKSGETGPRTQVIAPQLDAEPSEDVLSTAPEAFATDPLEERAEPEADLNNAPRQVGGFTPVIPNDELVLTEQLEPAAGFATEVDDEGDHFQSTPLDESGLNPEGSEGSEVAPAPEAELRPTIIAIPGFEDPADGPDDGAPPEISLDENAGLADRLWAARETAEAVKSYDGRSRAALYNALSLAYDFAVAAQRDPDEYAELLQESGVKAQARAPMTPIVKLVFGIDYDKTRLTEFASALSYAQRSDVALGGFGKFIENQPGGLKALVAAERQAKRPEPKADTKLDQARDRLRSAAPVALADIDSSSEFALVVTRRNADGVHEVVALIDDESLIDRAIRRAA